MMGNKDFSTDKFKEIVDSRDFNLMVPSSQFPMPGEYVLTSIQAGNIRGEIGWHKYIGYVVQVRKDAGAFGSHMILLRHPDGSLMRHENQAFCRMSGEWLVKAKAVFDLGVTPAEYEDYSQPYTLGGEYPEIGAIIEPKQNGEGPMRGGAPMAAITLSGADGVKTVTVC